ncbi:MAG: hypothetical protein PHH75_04910 [Candidatus Omnitrophica bacterium]|nr:hypothetical protein [Candidatus Omnitrophota bacterium]MDD5574502.1 hypothetical protein [Candidatus Omnitrophota bacterium]
MKTIALIAAVVLPLWNIPLIIKIHKRRSAEDFSRSWALGVWGCLALMFPAALQSEDVVFKTYSVVNIILFSMVVGWVLRFKK